MTPLQRRVGVALLNARLERGWSQRRMSIEAAVRPRTLRRVEAGHTLSWGTVEQLAAALGVRIEVNLNRRREP